MANNSFRRWLRRHHIYTGRVTRTRYYPERQDLPDVPQANELAIAGTPDHPKWALLDCPCGRGHTILLPLSKVMNPSWRVSVKRGVPTISPSIDRNRFEGTRCHYWIRDGRITWV